MRAGPISVGNVVLGLVVVFVSVGVPDAGRAQGSNQVEVKKKDHCSARAPADWGLVTNPTGTVAELADPARTMYAGWGVTAIDRAKQPYYGSLYGDPATSIQYLTSQIIAGTFGDRGGMQYMSAPQTFQQYFEIRSFASAGTLGYVFYKIYPVYWPQTYVESVYWAITARSQQGRLQDVLNVAASIHCDTQVAAERDRP